jgi:MoxR-like ATPase
VEIDGVTLHLPTPVELNCTWVGQQEVMIQLLASWSIIDPQDLPLNPRLLGKPGVGKTTLAYVAAEQMGRDVYLMQATMDTRPEDLIVSPVLGPDGSIRYMASPLVAAMIRGAVCILDEGNRMSERSWASLAPLLDYRRYVESVLAGIKISAHEDFRFVTTMNEDSSTYELPEYIHSRLMPKIYVDFPEEDEERAILESQVPYAQEEIISYVLEFLRAAHQVDLRYTVRDGINVARYAMKYMESGSTDSPQEAFGVAMELALGREEIEILPQAPVDDDE